MIAAIEQRRTRPQIIVCPECNGTRRLEYVDPDTLRIKSMPCVFCDSTGHFTRNASRAEHRSLIERLAGWGLNAIKAVML